MPFWPQGWSEGPTRSGQAEGVGRADPVAFAVILKPLHDIKAHRRGPAYRQSNAGCPSSRSFGTMGRGGSGSLETALDSQGAGRPWGKELP